MKHMGRKYNKKDMVFCIIYCNDALPYENYNEYLNSSSELVRNKCKTKTSMVLAQMRTDGLIGFPGGGVKKHHEDLIDALRSELEEEINFTELDETRLVKMRTSINSKRHITIYSYKVSYKELKDIWKDSNNGEHAISENCGTILLNLDKRYISNILRHKFIGTSLDDLKVLIGREGLIK